MSGDYDCNDPLEQRVFELEAHLMALERRLRHIEVGDAADEAVPPANLAESVGRLAPLMAELQDELSRATRLSLLAGGAPADAP